MSSILLGGTHIIVMIPGLLESLQGPGQSELDSGKLDSIERLLSKARQVKAAECSYEASLFSQFNLDTTNCNDAPTAAVTRMADMGHCDDGWWLRIDPVHLYPDRDQLLLFGPRNLEIQQHEADALINELNAHYVDDNWAFDAPHPERWYLRLSHSPDINTVPLAQVIGRDINLHLPSGKEGKSWHVILTEIQMLMHSSLINQEREQANRLTINSVWCWGGGRLPERVHGNWNLVCSNEPLSTGLAKLAGVAHTALSEKPSNWLSNLSEGNHLIVLDQLQECRLYADVPAWLQAVQELEQTWFTPLLESLHSGHVKVLELHGCDGRIFHIEPVDVRKFWKRTKRFRTFLQ